MLEENSESKLNNIKLNLLKGENIFTLKINILTFDKIENLDLHVETLNIDYIPIFSDKNNTIFEYLKLFKLKLYENKQYIFKIKVDLIKNFYNIILIKCLI